MSEKKPTQPSKADLSKGHLASEKLKSSLERIGSALRGLQFGSVNVIVQDGEVIQIDRTEKIRLRNAPRGNG